MFRTILAYCAVGAIRPQTLSRHLLLRKAQHWAPEDILRYKENLLRNTLRYAFEHSPYYRRGLYPFQMCWQGPRFDWNLFHQIPPLTKDAVKSEFGTLQSNEIAKLRAIQNRSGGSTGMPTKHMQDDHFRRMDMANNLLFKDWGNVKPGSKCLLISADERDYFGGRHGISKHLSDFLFNKRYFNAFNLKEDSLKHITQLIKHKRPEYIQVYVSAAYELARFILRSKISLPSPKMIMCTAGTTYPDMLDLIEQAFNCKAYARYGSRETGDMAGMCRDRVYHEMAFTHHIDVVDDDGCPVEPGETGRILVTVLTNRAMPLIRYSIGDLGTWKEGPCGCGVTFRSLEKVSGRVGETFRNSAGKLILPELIIHLIGVALGDLADDIVRFQVAQVEIQMIEVRVVVKAASRETVHTRLLGLQEQIRKVMEDEAIVKLVFLDEIPSLPSGKHCYTLSYVQ